MDFTENPKLSSLLRWVAKTVGRLMTNGGPWRVTIHGNGGMDIKAEFTVYETIM